MTTTRDQGALARANDRYSLRFRTATTRTDPKAWLDIGEAMRESDPPAAREAYAQAFRFGLGMTRSAAEQEVRSLDRIIDNTAVPTDFRSPTKEEVLAEDSYKLVERVGMER